MPSRSAQFSGLLGCLFAATASATAAVAAATSPLYIIRAPSVSMGGMNAEVLIEGLPAVTIGPNGCVALEPAAAVRRIRYRWRAGPLGNPNLETEFRAVPVALAPGQSSYLRLVTQTDALVGARAGLDSTTTWKMEQVPEREVKSYLARCRNRVLDRPAQD